MRTIGTLSLALLMVLVSAFEVPAASWDHVYKGDVLPDDEEWSVYKTDGIATSDVCKVTPDGELHITDPDDKVCFFMWDIDEPFHVTYEARLKVLSQSGAGYTVDFSLEDGALMTTVNLYTDHIEFGGVSHNVDMTQYHVLRMTRDDTDIVIYVDDEMVIEGLEGGDSADRVDFTFGAGSTGGAAEHYWDYVAFTTEGAYAPEELPSFWELSQAVESKGKVATCWGTIKSR